jgi:hypothetical protein
VFTRAHHLPLSSARLILSISWRCILILSYIFHSGLTLRTGLVSNYGATARRLRTTIPAVSILS